VGIGYEETIFRKETWTSFEHEKMSSLINNEINAR
jgi:hypothetical protein